MNWLDAIILLPLIYGLIRGLMKGFLSEVVSIAAIILGFIASKYWGGILSAWMETHWAWSATVCKAVAYGLLFIAIATVLTIIARLLHKFFHAIHLGGLNRLAGGLFGIAKWGIVVLVAVFCVNLLNIRFHFLPDDVVASSQLYQLALGWANIIWQQVEPATQALQQQL